MPSTTCSLLVTLHYLLPLPGTCGRSRGALPPSSLPRAPPCYTHIYMHTYDYVGHHALPPATPYHPYHPSQPCDSTTPHYSVHLSLPHNPLQPHNLTTSQPHNLTHLTTSPRTPPPPRSCYIMRFRPPAGVTLSEGATPSPVQRVTPGRGKKEA